MRNLHKFMIMFCVNNATLESMKNINFIKVDNFT